MKISGIYQIQSKVKPERIYIGSAIHIHRRWYNHTSRLRNNSHHSIKLQRHVNKYGLTDLVFSILLECRVENLIVLEQVFINYHSPYFNICKIAGSTTGVPSSTKGKHLSEEHKAKLRKPKSEECKRKLSEARKGKVPWNKGKHHSEETKEKIRQKRLGHPPSNKGKKVSPEILYKNRFSHVGLIQSEQTRLNRSRTFTIKRIKKYVELHKIDAMVFEFPKTELDIIIEGLEKLYLKYPEENINNLLSKLK
jgi:group I intron endonuclease